MKKLLLLLTASLFFLGARAGIDFPMDFQKYFDFDSSTLDGWTIYAPEGTPSGEYSAVFDNYKKYPYALAARMSNETLCFLWTNSEYLNGQPSDTWVITPEFEVTMDTEVLSFDVCVIGVDNTVQNNIDILISENGGVEKDDFKLFKSTSISGSLSGIYFFETQNRRIELTGYKGKKIHVALVNRNNHMGIMGFAAIEASSWYAGGYPDPASYDQILTDPGSTNDFEFSMNIASPITTTRYNVSFETSGGFKYSSEERAQIRLSSLTPINIRIPGITLTQPIETFRLTVTPQFDGAVPFVLTGSYVGAERLYSQVALLEEATGTWCGWCPYGAAALEFYTDKYPVSGDGSKVIAVALHDADSMQINSNISEYNDAFKYRWNIESYPNMVYNRQIIEIPSPYPNVFGSYLDKQFEQKSFVYAKLEKIYLNPDNEEDITAEYSVTATYDTGFRPMNVSVVISEDDVTGVGSSYAQTNYVSSTATETSILQDLGSEWLPYLEFYLNHGERIPQAEMVYNHVGRACYPSYWGQALPDFAANESVTGRIHFPLPANVNNVENMKVSLLVTDATTGEFIYGDQMGYADFTMESGVEKVSAASEFECSLQGDILSLTSTKDTEAALYTADGRLLKTFKVERGSHSYTLDAPRGILLLTVGTRTVKLLSK